MLSTDQTPGSRIDDLLDVGALAIEYRNAVRERAQVGDMMAVHGEIDRLAAELASTAEWISGVIRTVEELHALIERSSE